MSVWLSASMRCFLVIEVLIALMLLPACAITNNAQQSAPVPSTWAMELPPGWLQMKCNIPQCLVVVYDSKHIDYCASINVVYNVVGDMTLDQVFRAGEKTAPKVMKNYKLLEHKDVEVGGLPAYSVICTSTNDKLGTLKSKSFVVIRKGIAYTFTFGCLGKHFKEYSKEFDHVIASIKWVDPPANGQKGL